MTENGKESFVRWQGKSMDYLSYGINLILGFSIAGVGYGASLLRDTSFIPTGWAKALFGISLVFLILASTVGVACILNRLKDFRDTAAIARKKSKNEYDDELEELRELVGIIGKRTRCFFNWQVGLFGFGVLFLILSLSIAYSATLVY